MHTSNLFYNEPITSAAKRVLKASRMDRRLFYEQWHGGNRGSLKAAKKYAYTRDGHAGHEIIAMNHSFHGRSLGALSVTGNKHYQEPFEPLIPGIRFAEFNQLDSVKALINEKTCAIIWRRYRARVGIYPATDEFLQGVRALCDEHDILLILDEIQCGMGRTGEMFRMAALRCETGHYDQCEGAWMRCSGGSIPDDRARGGKVAGTGRSRDDLRRQPVLSEQQLTPCLR